MQTVGFFLGQDSDFISIAQEILPDGDGYRAVTHIPVVLTFDVRPLG